MDYVPVDLVGSASSVKTVTLTSYSLLKSGSFPEYLLHDSHVGASNRLEKADLPL